LDVGKERTLDVVIGFRLCLRDHGWELNGLVSGTQV
jgi:hypothetical protein